MGGQSFDDGADPLKGTPASSAGRSQRVGSDAGVHPTPDATDESSATPNDVRLVNGPDAGSSESAAVKAQTDASAGASPSVNPMTLALEPTGSDPTSASQFDASEPDAATRTPALDAASTATEPSTGSLPGADQDAATTDFARDRPLCGGSASQANATWCSGIQNIVLAVGELDDANGDGQLSAGEEATLSIEMHNQSDQNYNYPCVGLLTDTPALTILGGEGQDNPAWEYYSILGQQTLATRLRLRVGSDVESGTRVRFVAWVDVLNAGCTNGSELRFEFVIE
jgi:hypothetical protein